MLFDVTWLVWSWEEMLKLLVKTTKNLVLMIRFSTTVFRITRYFLFMENANKLRTGVIVMITKSKIVLQPVAFHHVNKRGGNSARSSLGIQIARLQLNHLLLMPQTELL